MADFTQKLRRRNWGFRAAAIFAISAVASFSHGGETPTRPEPRMSGMWVWQSKYVADLNEQDQLLAFCGRQGFNRLLVQIHWQKGTAQKVHPKPDEVVAPEAALHPVMGDADGFTRLVTEAAKRKIAVEALAGAPEMGDRANWPATLATVEAIIAFNATLPEGAKLAGIHWDIEPYTRSDWKSDQKVRDTIMADYLQLLADAKAKLKGSGLTLSVDIPMWYDHKTEPGDNCVIAFNGQTKNFHEHIQDLTDYVGIMSYRQQALGKNSTSEHVETEMAYAEKIGKFVVPAFETIELKDSPKITFFGLSAETFNGERQKLNDLFKDRPGYGGLFVHQYPSVRKLLEGDTPQVK